MEWPLAAKHSRIVRLSLPWAPHPLLAAAVAMLREFTCSGAEGTGGFAAVGAAAGVELAVAPGNAAIDETFAHLTASPA